MLVRLIDFLKMAEITALFTSLTQGGKDFEAADVGVSSLMDTWLLLRDIEANGARNRDLERHQVARHGPFQPGAGVCVHRPRSEPRGGLPRLGGPGARGAKAEPKAGIRRSA